MPSDTSEGSSLGRLRGEGDDSLSHQVLFSLGVTNSGKSYTIIGGDSVRRRKSQHDGLVPRMIDDLFATFDSKCEGVNDNAIKFTLQLSMMEVRNERVYDLLVRDDSDEGDSVRSSSRKRSAGSSRGKAIIGSV